MGIEKYVYLARLPKDGPTGSLVLDNVFVMAFLTETPDSSYKLPKFFHKQMSGTLVWLTVQVSPMASPISPDNAQSEFYLSVDGHGGV